MTAPKSLMETLGNSKVIYETIDGHLTNRPEFTVVAPVRR
jgi:hypothetical protein